MLFWITSGFICTAFKGFARWSSRVGRDRKKGNHHEENRGGRNMKEETIHYVLRFLKRNPSEDPKHQQAIKELSEIQNLLLDNYRDVTLFKIEQPKIVHLMVEKSVGTGPKAAAK